MHHSIDRLCVWKTCWRTTDQALKEAGLAQKPLYVVPNHMLEQFSREFMQLYPNAKLLVAGKDDFTKQRRKLLTAKIASGQWDGIIMTHSSFERLGMSRDYQARFLQDLRESERDVSSTGRHIDHQVIQLAPIGVAEELRPPKSSGIFNPS